MRFTHRAGLLTAIIGGLVAGATAARGQVNGNATINANDPVFGQISVSTSSQFAGAVSSIRWGGKEFINNWDHGRQLQPNAEFFNRYECYNPYEAGSKDDGNKLTTSSKLLALSASGSRLESTTQMAWYLPTHDPRQPASQYGDNCGDPAQFISPVPPYNGNLLSDYKVHKTVQIGLPGIPNVIEYKSDLTIPEAVRKGLNQITAVVPWDFSIVRSYDVVSKGYRNIRSFGGGDDSTKVVATPDGSYALGFYTPESLQPYGNGNDTAAWWFVVPPNPFYKDSKGQIDMDYACVHVGSVTQYESAKAGDVTHDRAYLVLGNLEQVREGLSKIHFQFRALDPDIFNWRDYVAINHLESTVTTLPAAENHWLTIGLNQGLRGSRTFSASQYLQINPDLRSYYGANNYQGAIDHYINSGRSEGRSTTVQPSAGMQHLAVLANRDVTVAGENVFGERGSDTTGTGPTRVDLSYVTEVAAGDYTSFAVKSDGSLWMWGSNQYGAKADGSSGDSITNAVQVPLSVQVATPLRSGRHAVAVGTGAYAAVDTNGQVWTWGVNWNGRLGDGTTATRFAPGRVRKSANADDYLTGVVSISAAGGTMAAVDADGTVWTWGAGTSGALGNGTMQDSSFAVQVQTTGPGNVGMTLYGVTNVACGASGFCIAQTRYGGVFGWGNNDFSQLGIAPGGNLSIATWIVVAPTGAPVDAIAAGAAHCIARATDGKVYGWGYNGRGQLGTGTLNVAQFPPTAMNSGPDGMGDVTALGAGTNFSVMTRGSDRAVFVTGDNQSGQLGTGSSVVNQLVPVKSSLSPAGG